MQEIEYLMTQGKTAEERLIVSCLGTQKADESRAELRTYVVSANRRKSDLWLRQTIDILVYVCIQSEHCVYLCICWVRFLVHKQLSFGTYFDYRICDPTLKDKMEYDRKGPKEGPTKTFG